MTPSVIGDVLGLGRTSVSGHLQKLLWHCRLRQTVLVIMVLIVCLSSISGVNGGFPQEDIACTRFHYFVSEFWGFVERNPSLMPLPKFLLIKIFGFSFQGGCCNPDTCDCDDGASDFPWCPDRDPESPSDKAPDRNLTFQCAVYTCQPHMIANFIACGTRDCKFETSTRRPVRPPPESQYFDSDLATSTIMKYRAILIIFSIILSIFFTP